MDVIIEYIFCFSSSCLEFWGLLGALCLICFPFPSSTSHYCAPYAEYIVISEMDRRGWLWKKKTSDKTTLEKTVAASGSDVASLASVESLSDKVCSLKLKLKRCIGPIQDHSSVRFSSLEI